MVTRTNPLGRHERSFPRRQPGTLARLRDEVRRLERAIAPDTGAHGTVTLGIAEIDQHLPWGGLPRGALHEVIIEDPGAGVGFAAVLAGRVAAREEEKGNGGMGVWGGRGGPPGSGEDTAGIQALSHFVCRLLL